MDGNSGNAAPRKILARPYTYLALCWAPALLVLLYVFLALSGHVRPWELGIVIGFLAIMLYVVHCYGIEVTSDGIRYSRPFSAPSSVRWSSIRAVHAGVNLRRSRSAPLHFLRIDRSDTVTPFFVNIKPFGAQDLSQLVRTIREKAPHAALTPAAERMMAGSMPSFAGAAGGSEAF